MIRDECTTGSFVGGGSGWCAQGESRGSAFCFCRFFFEGVELARTFASVPFLWFLVAEENLEVENT